MKIIQMNSRNSQLNWSARSFFSVSVLACCFFLLGLSGCFDFVTARKMPELPQEKQISFQSTQQLAAGATVNLEKAAEIYYKGVAPLSDIAKFVYDWAIRMVGVLGINTEFDPSDPEQLKAVLDGGTKALEEKNQIIHDLKADVKKARDTALTERTSRVKAESRSAGFLTWIKRLIVIAIILFVIQIFTGIPIFTGATKAMKRLGKQTVKGIEEYREQLKKDAAEGNAEAQHALDNLDTTLSRHQDEKVKKHVEKMRNGG